MKKTKLFALAFAALALGACSNDDIVEQQGGGSTTTTVDAGYVNLAINLPSQPATRAAANDVFDDGLESEYDVNNAMILVFEDGTATSESDYKFIKAYDMSNLKPWEPVGGNVTVTANMVQEVPAKSNEDYNRYALVVLNNNGIISINSADGSVTYNNTKITKYGDLLAASTMDESKMRTNGFFMTNAPIADKAWESTTSDLKVNTLVNIENSIATTEAEALEKPMAEVYVERGLAKVTLASNTNVEKTITDGTYKNDKVTITAWGLSVTNKTSKAVRDVTGWEAWAKLSQNNSNGFFGTAANPYRVYWGVDGNYDDATITAANNSTYFNILNKNDNEVTSNKFGSENPLYCLENTFDIKNQKKNQTTKIIFKAKYTPDGSLADPDGTFYLLGTSSDIYNTALVNEKINQYLMKECGKTIGVFDPAATANNVVITMPNTGGNYTMADVTVKYTWYKIGDKYVEKSTYDASQETAGVGKTTGTATLTAEELAKIGGHIGTIAYHKEGVSYYEARIQHFGDTYCPWVSGDNTYDEVDLGRWGVLRNNWYELSVTKVSGPGSAEIIPDTDEWDDVDKYYISVKVNVLAWAKRTQSVEL